MVDERGHEKKKKERRSIRMPPPSSTLPPSKLVPLHARGAPDCGSHFSLEKLEHEKKDKVAGKASCKEAHRKRSDLWGKKAKKMMGGKKNAARSLDL